MRLTDDKHPRIAAGSGARCATADILPAKEGSRLDSVIGWKKEAIARAVATDAERRGLVRVESGLAGLVTRSVQTDPRPSSACTRS